MTAAQTQASVDAWLAARADGIARLEYFGLLARQWHAVSREFGADSSAAKGVLLGLVRQAWGDETVTCEWTGASGYPWCVRISWRRIEGSSEACALASALEVSP